MNSICFDLDGTLSYYPLSVEEVLGRALTQLGLREDALGDLTQAASRYAELWLTLEQPANSAETLRLGILTQLLSEFGINGESIAHEMAAAYSTIRRETGVRLYPGVESLLEDLRGHYRLGLLTNGPSDMQWEKIEELELAHRMDAIIVSGDVGIYKPDVHVFEKLLSQLDAEPNQALFVGDSYAADIAGAQQAGMYTAWIHHDAAETTPSMEPTITCAKVTELREVLL